MPSRVLVLGDHASASRFANIVGHSEDVHVVASEPLSAKAIGGTPAALEKLRNSYEIAEKTAAKPFSFVTVTPEQLRESRLPLHVVCESVAVSNLVVVNRSSVIDSLVSQKLGAHHAQETTLCDTEIEEYLAKTLTDWDYVAQTLPVGATFEGKAGGIATTQNHALLDNCDITFIEFDDLVTDPTTVLQFVATALSFSMTGVSEHIEEELVKRKERVTLGRRVSNMGELSQENLELSISVKNILLYRAESSEEDQSSVSILMSDTDAGSASDASGDKAMEAVAPLSPVHSPEAYISALRSVATSYDYSNASSIKRRHPMHESTASYGAATFNNKFISRSEKVDRHVAVPSPSLDEAKANKYTSEKSVNASYKLLGYFAMNVFFFHCLEAFLKEKIFHVPGFSHVELLTVMQSVIVGSLALLDCGRMQSKEMKDREESKSFLQSILSNKSETPLWVYLLLGSLIATSQYMTNKSILYLDYVTQVVFKSSKLLWVMAARVFFLKSKKKPSLVEWGGGVMIVAGLLTLSANTLDSSKHKAKPGASDNMKLQGLFCIVLALFCDAGVFIVEEALAFGKYHASKQEVILFMQVMAVIPSTFFLMGSGKVWASLEFVTSNPILLGLVLACYACSYMGTRSILALVEAFDGTVAALVTSVRKIATIILSFILFPKPLTLHYAIGAVLIIVGANTSIVKKFGNGGMEAKK